MSNASIHEDDSIFDRRGFFSNTSSQNLAAGGVTAQTVVLDSDDWSDVGITLASSEVTCAWDGAAEVSLCVRNLIDSSSALVTVLFWIEHWNGSAWALIPQTRVQTLHTRGGALTYNASCASIPFPMAIASGDKFKLIAQQATPGHNTSIGTNNARLLVRRIRTET